MTETMLCRLDGDERHSDDHCNQSDDHQVQEGPADRRPVEDLGRRGRRPVYHVDASTTGQLGRMGGVHTRSVAPPTGDVTGR
jgi:hypothetical protein